MNIQCRDHHDQKNAHDHLFYVCASKSKIVTNSYLFPVLLISAILYELASLIGMPTSSNASIVVIHRLDVVSHAAVHLTILVTYGACTLSCIILRVKVLPTVEYLAPIVNYTIVTLFLANVYTYAYLHPLLSPPGRMSFDETEAAYSYQGSQPNHTAARIAPIYAKGALSHRELGVDSSLLVRGGGYHVFYALLLPIDYI